MSRLRQIEAGVSPAQQLQEVRRAQRSLAWLLSVSTLVITVGFFVMMTIAAPLLSRVVYGQSVTLANVLATAVILFYLVAITIFARQSDRWDVRLRELRGQQ